MELKEGMRIKIFDNTNVESYRDLIKSCGYRCQVYKTYIRIGEPLKVFYDNGMLGRLINRKRRAKKMTREDLSKVLLCSTGTIYDWEAGRRRPSNHFMKQLQEILNISMGELEQCRIQELSK